MSDYEKPEGFNQMIDHFINEIEETDDELAARTERNINLIGAFVDHVQKETGIEIPDEAVESFFGA
ncbi:hypothetical protein [Spirosoma sordidisoli]|uniref:Uncharacterized protein n=1 Tax=Spirosoma sordidisoli TaxID=2502893 RepID=A0A4Q2UNA2_9BACT|nr:hypothetical protein [Spirosoma sordidisoli]RYC70894.1 hypothetical protein EQG79_01705 [Spirosoma sordidisoli]